MKKAAPLVVLTILPLIASIGASPVEDAVVPSGGAVSCQLVPGRLAVAVTDHNGQPMKHVSVRVSNIAVPEEKVYSAWGSLQKGEASTGDDGCAYIELANVEKGKRRYYVWAVPHQYRARRKGVTVDATTPEKAGVIQEEVKQLPGDRCYAFCPFLWTKEGSLEASTRATVPVQEAFDLKLDIARQLGVTGA